MIIKYQYYTFNRTEIKQIILIKSNRKELNLTDKFLKVKHYSIL